MNSMYNSLQVSWNRRFTSGSMFGVTYTLSKSMDNGSNYRDIVPDTYNTSNLWGPSEYDTRHIVIVNYLYDLPFFKNSNDLTGKLLGGWEAGRRDAIPDGYAVRNRHQQRFRGRRRVRQLRLRFRRSVLESQRTASASIPERFAGPVTNSSSPNYFTANVTSAGGRHIQPATGCPRLRLPARNPGLEPVSVQEVRDQRTGRIPVPRGSLRLHQPCEPERPESQPDIQPVRDDHQQVRLGPATAAFG